MKKTEMIKEFERMEKMYRNCSGVHSYMDLPTFAYNYYDKQIKDMEERRRLWIPKKLERFLDANKAELTE